MTSAQKAEGGVRKDDNNKQTIIIIIYIKNTMKNVVSRKFCKKRLKKLEMSRFTSSHGVSHHASMYVTG